jgi:hypothetical protein
MKRVYIAGPMTGIPQFNYPAFIDAARVLRSEGFDVQSPAEMDDPETAKAAMASVDGAPGSGSANGETWGDFLARDVKLLVDDGIEAIVVLPGWARSRGARLETFVASRMAGLPILRLGPPENGFSLWHVPFHELTRAWIGEDFWEDLDILFANRQSAFFQEKREAMWSSR